MNDKCEKAVNLLKDVKKQRKYLNKDIATVDWIIKKLGGDGKMKVMLDDGAYMPERAHELDAGYDIRTPHDVAIYPSNSAVIDTGVHVQIPEGHVGFLKSKSGLNVISGITGEGVIDAGYTGCIKVKLYNNGYDVQLFHAGDKIIQLVILPIYTPELEQVDSLEETERGNNGFGSTGR